VPGRPIGPWPLRTERRRRPRPDGTGPSVRTGSAAHGPEGRSGRQRARSARSNRSSPGPWLRQPAGRRWPDQIVVPRRRTNPHSPSAAPPPAACPRAP
jgi:hypothetical protein